MSSPPNPLDIFRTYSYHHMLYVCDGTSTAEELASATDDNFFQYTRQFSGSDKYDVLNTAGGGFYVMLVDGRSDASISIKEAGWSTTVVPHQRVGKRAQFHTIETEGQIIIIEPLGMQFMNIVVNSCLELNVDISTAVFVLKTYFVGHSDTGATEDVMRSKGYIFIISDLQATFDETGSTYKMDTMAAANGIGKTPAMNAPSDGLTVKIEEKSTLKDALNKAIEQININYNKSVDKVIADKDCVEARLPIENYTRITYTLEIDEYYEQSRFLAGTNENPRTLNTGVGGDASSGMVGDYGIDDILHNIMQTSIEVVREHNKPEPDKKAQKRYGYKITSTQKSDIGVFEMAYQIHRYELPQDPVDPGSPWKVEPSGGDGIEFDYIFTGKNIDIVDFDFDLSMGLGFLQLLIGETTLPNPRDTAGSNHTPTSSATTGEATGTSFQDMSDVPGAVAKGTTAANNGEAAHKRGHVSTSEFNSMLTRYAAFESVQAKLKIRGNPQLMGDFTQFPSDMSPAKKTGDVMENSDRTIVRNINQKPGFAKVNIKMPEYAEDGSLSYIDFWYRGWYMIHTINNRFVGGEFTQELDMYAWPTDDGQFKFIDRPKDKCKKGEDSPGVDTVLNKNTTQQTLNARYEAVKDKIAESDYELAAGGGGEVQP